MLRNNIYYGKGLDRLKYLENVATLQDFNVIENDWKEIFRWIMSVGHNIAYFNSENKKLKGSGITSLWDNHIFTILIEISQKDVDSYQNSFVEVRGVEQQKEYILNLENRIKKWIKRIDLFLNIEFQKRAVMDGDLLLQVTLTIKKQLEFSVSELHNTDIQMQYYGMLNVIKDIGQKCDFYITQIESSKNMDPLLALLLTFVRNYTSVVGRMNGLVPDLAGFYRDNILHVRAKEALPCTTQLIITPATTTKDYYVPKGTTFVAGVDDTGADILYKAITETKINKLALKGICALYLETDEENSSNVIAIHKKDIDYFNSGEIIPLFIDDKKSYSVSCGWMIEAQILILEEGERAITISMDLTRQSVQFLKSYGVNENLSDSFTLFISNEIGWSEVASEVKYNTGKLLFSFKLKTEDIATTPCKKEIHKCDTTYPAIRLTLKNGKTFPYNWAKMTEFLSVSIAVKIDGIRKLMVYNDAGEQDVTTPIYPFGSQAKRGTKFVIKNNEISGKPLINVSIKGTWSQLPPDASGFTPIYKKYPSSAPIKNSSFKVKTEWQKGNLWYGDKDNFQPLFQADLKDFISENYEINLIQVKKTKTAYLINYDRDYSGAFRVTLVAPSIGFGTDEYRQLFADVMLHNSRHKDDELKVLPILPIVPMLSNLELSYFAEQTIEFNSINNDEKILLYRITPLSNLSDTPLDSCYSQPLVQKIENSHTLLLGFENALETSSLRIYFDLVPYKIDKFDNRVDISSNNPVLSFEYGKNGYTKPILMLDETNGLTQSGYVEVQFSEQISTDKIDEQGAFWLLMNVSGDTNQCLALRNVYLNCITVKANGGDGSNLPQHTIEKSLDELPWVKEISQPFDGIGGKPAEDKNRLATRLTSRSANRNRALSPSDYEQMIIERFAEIEKVYCIPTGGPNNASKVIIVVFFRIENELYPNAPVWLLKAVKEYLTSYISPWVELDVINPVYEKVIVECEFEHREGASIGTVICRMNRRINGYFGKWVKTRVLPQINQRYSYKGLHSILSNDEGIDKLTKLLINNQQPTDSNDLYVKGTKSWVVLIPSENHLIRLRKKGINEGVLGVDFVIN